MFVPEKGKGMDRIMKQAVVEKKKFMLMLTGILLIGMCVAS